MTIRLVPGMACIHESVVWTQTVTVLPPAGAGVGVGAGVGGAGVAPAEVPGVAAGATVGMILAEVPGVAPGATAGVALGAVVGVAPLVVPGVASAVAAGVVSVVAVGDGWLAVGMLLAGSPPEPQPAISKTTLHRAIIDTMVLTERLVNPPGLCSFLYSGLLTVSGLFISDLSLLITFDENKYT